MSTSAAENSRIAFHAGLAAELESREVAWQRERQELEASSQRALEAAEAARRATEAELAVCKEDLSATMEQLGEMQNMMSETTLDAEEQVLPPPPACLQVYLTQCINQMCLESQLFPQNFDLSFESVIVSNQLTILRGC